MSRGLFSDVLLNAPPFKVSGQLLTMMEGWADVPTFIELEVALDRATQHNEANDFAIAVLGFLMNDRRHMESLDKDLS